MGNNQYLFHEDPGHGWLEVPIQTIKDLNLTDKITPYSYMDQHSVYLEEDCDLTTFMNTLKERGIKLNICGGHKPGNGTACFCCGCQFIKLLLA